MGRIILTASIALFVGLVGGVALAFVAFQPPKARLDCTLGSDGTISTCVNQQGNQVDVPHDIHVRTR